MIKLYFYIKRKEVLLSTRNDYFGTTFQVSSCENIYYCFRFVRTLGQSNLISFGLPLTSLLVKAQLES